MRETVQDKAMRYVRERRLRIHRVDELARVVEASCRGDQVYQLGRDEEGFWWCGCPARRRCAHLEALQCVVRLEAA